jgi:hypothetical protein
MADYRTEGDLARERKRQRLAPVALTPHLAPHLALMSRVRVLVFRGVFIPQVVASLRGRCIDNRLLKFMTMQRNLVELITQLLGHVEAARGEYRCDFL